MKLEKLSAAAELVSSIAIVITLGYLAIQTSQTRSALQANSREAIMLAEVSMLTTFANNPEMNVNLNATDLPEIDRFQVGNMLAAGTRVREFAWFQYQAGVMDSRTWESHIIPAARLLSGPQGAPWWQRSRQEFDPDFAAEVDRRIREYSSR